jgi:hypothetical protein
VQLQAPRGSPLHWHAALRQTLGDEATRPHAVELIRSLLDRVEVHPSQERGRCEVIIVGALAQLLAFAQQKTTAASPGDGGTFLMSQPP